MEEDKLAGNLKDTLCHTMSWFTSVQYIALYNFKSTIYKDRFGLNGLYGRNDTIREGDFNSKARLMRRGYIREKSIDFSFFVYFSPFKCLIFIQEI